MRAAERKGDRYPAGLAAATNGEEAGVRGWRVWPSRTFWSYALLQLPDILAAAVVLWLLQRWGMLSTGWAVSLLILWVAKDFALYPVVRGVLVPRGTESDPLIGSRGVALESLAPRGQIRLDGEIWHAESRIPGQAIAPGTPVVVRSTRGLTLIVEPAEGAPGR